MLHLILSRQPLTYRAMRGLQICTVFAVTILIQELIGFPRAGWTGFAVMMIYAGFDNGTTLLRAFHRFWGMLLGLFSGYVLWFLGHLDYRILILVIPLTIFFAYYLAGQAYSVPTVFTVNTAVIGTGFFAAHSDFSITFFLLDYGACTVLALAIIVFFEHFIFRRYEMMPRFICDMQQEVVSHLYALVQLLNQVQIRRSIWFRHCINLNRAMVEVNNLVHNAQFEFSAGREIGAEFNDFVALSQRIFMGIKGLYSAYYTKRYHKYDYCQLFEQVQQDLNRLAILLADGTKYTIHSGVIREEHH